MRLFVGICMGIIAGLVVYLTIESKAPSYLSDDSKACANCHVMLSSYNTWEQSSHRENAQCIDCHIPHENIVRQYVAKGMDGLRHAYVFSANSYPEVIRATDTARSTIQANCIRCHDNLLNTTPAHNADLLSYGKNGRVCWECHRHVPHSTGNSISTFQGVRTQSGRISSYPK